MSTVVEGCRHYPSQGRNAPWHVDGYIKLKPYVIAISACIDGFSFHNFYILFTKFCLLYVNFILEIST